MTAPVSLAEIRNRMANSAHLVLTHRELEPLVELAEAYLAVRALDPTYGADIQKGREYADARARLALAAKGVADGRIRMREFIVDDTTVRSKSK